MSIDQIPTQPTEGERRLIELVRDLAADPAWIAAFVVRVDGDVELVGEPDACEAMMFRFRRMMAEQDQQEFDYTNVTELKPARLLTARREPAP